VLVRADCGSRSGFHHSSIESGKNSMLRRLTSDADFSPRKRHQDFSRAPRPDATHTREDEYSYVREGRMGRCSCDTCLGGPRDTTRTQDRAVQCTRVLEPRKGRIPQNAAPRYPKMRHAESTLSSPDLCRRRCVAYSWPATLVTVRAFKRSFEIIKKRHTSTCAGLIQRFGVALSLRAPSACAPSPQTRSPAGRGMLTPASSVRYVPLPKHDRAVKQRATSPRVADGTSRSNGA